MYNYVFILEDDVTQANTLQSYILQYSPTLRPVIAHSAKEAMDTLRTQSDFAAYLLDISIGEEQNHDGLEVARTICKMNANPHLIFITAYTDHVFSAINDYHCSAYLLKPYTKETLYKQLDPLFSQPEYLSLRALDGVYWKISYSDIYYIESYSRYMYFHTANGVIKSRQYRLKDIEQLLSDDFVRCHKSYVVNTTYISAINSGDHLLHLHTIDENIPYGKDFVNKQISSQ